MTWQVLFFLPRVAGFSPPKSHRTWIFGFLKLFAEYAKKASLEGEGPEAKTIKKTLLQKYNFSDFFCSRDF
jgi:hypothetical protein